MNLTATARNVKYVGATANSACALSCFIRLPVKFRKLFSPWFAAVASTNIPDSQRDNLVHPSTLKPHLIRRARSMLVPTLAFVMRTPVAKSLVWPSRGQRWQYLLLSSWWEIIKIVLVYHESQNQAPVADALFASSIIATPHFSVHYFQFHCLQTYTHYYVYMHACYYIYIHGTT